MHHDDRKCRQSQGERDREAAGSLPLQDGEGCEQKKCIQNDYRDYLSIVRGGYDMEEIKEDELAQRIRIQVGRPWMVKLKPGVMPNQQLEMFGVLNLKRIYGKVAALDNRSSKEIGIDSEKKKNKRGGQCKSRIHNAL
jgi:hypothetical protein